MSPGSLIHRTLVIVLCSVAAMACGGDADSVADESTGPSTPTDSAAVTSEPTGDAGATMVVAELTVEKVLAWIDSEYPGSVPACADVGRVEVGDVFACGGPPATAPVEYGGTVIYVLDESGRAVWDSATDIPDSTDGVLSAYDRAPKGLLCRDLLDPQIDAYPFRQLSTPGVNYFWSLVYWSLEGEPDRMDADQDSVPCETLYDPAVVRDVLAGGPVS